MKYLSILFVIILYSSCSTSECYECKDGNATIEVSDQFPSGLDIQIPNFAVEGQETIPLVSIHRLDSNPISFSDVSLTLTGKNSELLYKGDADQFITYQSSLDIPVSLLFSGDQLVEGQIHFDLTLKDSITSLQFVIEGSFLFVSCATYLNSDTQIENIEDCRDNMNTYDIWSGNEYGC